MARTKKSKRISYWKQVYRSAIEFMGKVIPKKMSLPSLRKTWKGIRKEHVNESIELPSVTTVAKTAKEYEYEETPRDEEMNTLPMDEDYWDEDSEEYKRSEDFYNWADEYIRNYKETIRDIYNETLAYLDSAPLNSKGNVKDPEHYFASQHRNVISAEYNQIISLIDNYVDTYGVEQVADQLSINAELNYTLALVWMPPSDVQDNFQLTIETLTSLTFRELAEFGWR